MPIRSLKVKFFVTWLKFCGKRAMFYNQLEKMQYSGYHSLIYCIYLYSSKTIATRCTV